MAAGSSRVVARVLDLCVVIVVHLALRAVIDDGFDDAQPSSAVSLLTLVFAVAYEVGMVAARGATLGKLVTSLRVVTLDGVTPPPVRTAAMRWLPNLVAAFPLVGPFVALALVLASLLWVFTDPERRSVFDRTGPTRVVRVAPGSAGWADRGGAARE